MASETQVYDAEYARRIAGSATFPEPWWVTGVESYPHQAVYRSPESPRETRPARGLYWARHPGLTAISEATFDASQIEVIGLGTEDDGDCPICKNKLSDKSGVNDHTGNRLDVLCGIARHDTCGRTMHKACLAGWVSSFVGREDGCGSGEVISCPMCRGHIGQVGRWREECGKVHLGPCESVNCFVSGKSGDIKARTRKWWMGPSDGFVAARQREEERKTCLVGIALARGYLDQLRGLVERFAGMAMPSICARIRRDIVMGEEHIERDFGEPAMRQPMRQLRLHRASLLKSLTRKVEMWTKEADSWVIPSDPSTWDPWHFA